MSVSLFDLKGRTALMSGAGRGIGLLGRRTDCAEWTIGSETRGRRDPTGGGRHRIETLLTLVAYQAVEDPSHNWQQVCHGIDQGR